MNGIKKHWIILTIAGLAVVISVTALIVTLTTISSNNKLVEAERAERMEAERVEQQAIQQATTDYELYLSENNANIENMAKVQYAYEFYKTMNYEGQALIEVTQLVQDDINESLGLLIGEGLNIGDINDLEEVVSASFITESNKDRFEKTKGVFDNLADSLIDALKNIGETTNE